MIMRTQSLLCQMNFARNYHEIKAIEPTIIEIAEEVLGTFSIFNR